MHKRFLASLFAIAFLAACTSNTPTQVVSPHTTVTSTASGMQTAPTPERTLPPAVIEGPDPSYKVAAFYYPWYGNPTTDGNWIHWDQNNHAPPMDIASDYYPALGAYSSKDPAVLEQHMKWLRQAGIGVIISSWWGQGSKEDQAVPLLLQTAERYKIKVAFHIEPYSGRTAESLVSDIQYLYKQYGDSPAFFRSTETSHYSPSNQPKGMFFVWSIGVKGAENEHVQPDYWQSAIDSIHALPESALIIGNSTKSSWIDGSHFDGLYNYASLHIEQHGGFGWAQSLPADSLYVPSVIPGFSARRVGYAENTFVSRDDGRTYAEQWNAALNTGVQPALVTITSFNEWHEGSMIEPPRFGVNNGNGYSYADFGSLPAEGYLSLTRDWVNKYLSMSWPNRPHASLPLSEGHLNGWNPIDSPPGENKIGLLTNQAGLSVSFSKRKGLSY